MSRKASSYFNVLILAILLCIIGYNLKQIAIKQQEPKNERLVNLNITPIPTFVISVPETSNDSTPTPRKDSGSVSANEIRNKEVSIIIPKIDLNSTLGVAETISNDGQLTLTEPENIPLWIEGWSVDIGDSGLSIIMLVTCTPWGSNAQRLLIILKLEAIRESTT